MGVIDFLSDKQFSIPLGEVIIFVILNSLCILFGKYKLGLLLSYCFVFYWGFVANLRYFVNILGDTSYGMIGYIFFGIAMLLLAIVGFFTEAKE
ncbi:MAG: hypothetical protein Kow0025_17140 [Thermodesulfovibrionales bacterium]